MHEIGWCQMIQLMFKEAQNTFVTLKSMSRWSRAFYTYCSTLCTGSLNGQSETLTEEFNESMKRLPKGTQLDTFLNRRHQVLCDMVSNQTRDDVFYKILIYELLYLWNTLPSCNSNNIDQIIQGKET